MCRIFPGVWEKMPSKNLNLPLLGETLTRHYRLSCELYDTYPKGRFTYQLSHATLSLDLAEIDGSHLEALCHTICNKLSPVSIQVSISPAKDGNSIFTLYITNNVLKP